MAAADTELAGSRLTVPDRPVAVATTEHNRPDRLVGDLESRPVTIVERDDLRGRDYGLNEAMNVLRASRWCASRRCARRYRKKVDRADGMARGPEFPRTGPPKAFPPAC